MGKGLYISLIPGIMCGIEWNYLNGFFVVDLLIFRCVFDYRGITEKG